MLGSGSADVFAAPRRAVCWSAPSWETEVGTRLHAEPVVFWGGERRPEEAPAGLAGDLHGS